MTHLRRFHWARHVAAAAAIAATACHGKPKTAAPPTPVRVATATRIDAPVTVTASGIVEPMQTVAVTAQVSGKLTKVAFHEGDFVDVGAVLFQIDPRPLEATLAQASAALNRDAAQAEADARDDARYQALVDKGYVTRSQADQIHATAVAQAATVAADSANLRAAQLNLDYTTIRAPIAGRTGSLLIREGNVVSPGPTPLVVINQIKPVLVRFPILQQDFSRLQNAVAGHPLAVSAASMDSTQATENGTLSFLDNTADSLTGTVMGKATFPNISSHLWPGELVVLTVVVTVEHNVLAVPTAAIQAGQQGPFVYIATPAGTAQTRQVAPGIVVGTLTVVDTGITDGERVVTDGQSRLNPGAKIAVATDSAGRSGRAGSDTGMSASVGTETPGASPSPTTMAASPARKTP